VNVVWSGVNPGFQPQKSICKKIMHCYSYTESHFLWLRHLHETVSSSLLIHISLGTNQQLEIYMQQWWNRTISWQVLLKSCHLWDAPL
jgi:hypothetical protein